jgi:hypothetical protein
MEWVQIRLYIKNNPAQWENDHENPGDHHP